MSYDHYARTKLLVEMVRTLDSNAASKIESALECGMSSTEILMNIRYQLNESRDIFQKNPEAHQLSAEILGQINASLSGGD